MEPDYGSASLPDLYEALRHIDGQAYPARLARLRAEIERREAQLGTEADDDLRVPLPVLAAARSAYWYVCLTAAGLVLAQVVYFTSSGFKSLFFRVVVLVPGPSGWTDQVLTWSATAIVTLALAAGALSWRYRRAPFVWFLGSGFLGLSVRLKLGGLAWWPQLRAGDFNVHFGVSVNQASGWGIQLLVVPLLLTIWAVLLEEVSDEEVPDYLAEKADAPAA